MMGVMTDKAKQRYGVPMSYKNDDDTSLSENINNSHSTIKESKE